MPNNMPTPRGKSGPDPDFTIIRQLDGHITHTSGNQGANPHDPKTEVIEQYPVEEREYDGA